MSAALSALRVRSPPPSRLTAYSHSKNSLLLRSSWSPLVIGVHAHGRRYATPPTGHEPGRTSQTKKPPSLSAAPVQPKPRTAAPAPELPHARHEVHEGSAQISMPFNPPGGGPSASPKGFTFTNSPVLDAILTTAMGLAAGAFITSSWSS